VDYYIDVINESTSVTSRVYDFQNQGQAKPFRKVHGQPKGNEITDMIEIDKLFAESEGYNAVRITFRKPETKWGTSVWWVELEGRFAGHNM